jgi:diadenosine tetraphosphate (Ap4A) HIT family hydrolase
MDFSLFTHFIDFDRLVRNLNARGFMNFYPNKILSTFHSLFGNAQSLVNEEAIVLKYGSVQVIVPERPLAPGSLKIQPRSNAANFSEWKPESQQEAYFLIQRIVHIWKAQGIADYLIYGKETDASKSIFSWEIVPFPKNGNRIWKQFKVLWNTAFGSFSISRTEQKRIAEDFNHALLRDRWAQIEPIKRAVREKDPFCNQNIIEKQLVFEGKEINILYNHAPIVLGKEKLHFLLVPKRHCQKFSELTESEYLEVAQLSQNLTEFYKSKGYPTAYLFNKSGVEAGQTVPHWHEHLIFTATKTQEFFGKLRILKNMLLGSTPLPPKELQNRVESLRNAWNR